jgi:4-hydroxybenzoate polyprenyltransferase
LIVFILALIPVILSIIYSPLNLKKILFVKNSIVAVAWGTIPLFVGAYYCEILQTEIISLSIFFTVGLFRNTILFDIKDITGDLKEGVKTIPNTYGAANTKFLAVLINLSLIISLLTLILTNYLDYSFLILLIYNTYIFIYVHLLNMKSGELFYSVVVDGACIFLGIFVLLAGNLGVI